MRISELSRLASIMYYVTTKVRRRTASLLAINLQRRQCSPRGKSEISVPSLWHASYSLPSASHLLYQLHMQRVTAHLLHGLWLHLLMPCRFSLKLMLKCMRGRVRVLGLQQTRARAAITPKAFILGTASLF